MTAVATEFDQIIRTARERKKNEALADKIFSKGRRQSAPSQVKATPGGSLASRVGVRKPQQQQQQQQQQQRTSQRRRSVPSGNVNGEWTHDLHTSINGSSSGSLSSRITLPNGNSTNANTASTKRAAKKKAAKLTAVLDLLDTDSVKQQVNIIKPVTRSQKRDAGMTIRGLAGPFAVMGQNFAPGTTAADVESAMTPVGGEMVSCKVVKTQPFMIIEMVFASREGGERVIETFNNKTADGRVIKVYPKPSGYQPSSSASVASTRSSRDQIVDGTMGFNSDDLMSTDKAASSSNDNRLHYSDKPNSTGAPTNRRGRGFQRGRGGR